jgi:YD repeat-containing protein
MELEYDVRNRISSQKIILGRTKIQNTMTYSADGHLFEVTGSSDWKYIYDENGNIIGIMDYGQKLTLGYDVGDRVVQVIYIIYLHITVSVTHLNILFYFIFLNHFSGCRL